MKHALTIIIAMLISITAASAATAPELPDAGLVPGDALYIIDLAFERVELAFTRSPEARVEKRLEHALERSAEAKAVLEREDLEAGESERRFLVAERLRTEAMNRVAEEAEAVEDAEVLEAISIEIQGVEQAHARILEEVVPNLPEQARETVRTAITTATADAEDREAMVQARITENRRNPQ